jgi:putative Holliday junction resolvase
VRFLGIDYGQRRIGLALSDPTGLLARPWKKMTPRGDRTQVASAIVSEIQHLLREDDGLAGVVLGFPRTLDGEHTDATAAILALAADLRARIDVPLVMQDERLSSREAESLLARRIRNWRDRKPLVDAAAAAVILQDYLDARNRATGTAAEDHPS